MRRPAFDLVAICDQWGSTRDPAYLQVMAVFASEANELCNNLRAAHEVRQPSALRVAAHTLRGAAGNVGALTLAECAASLEASAMHMTQQELRALLVDLETAWREVRDALCSDEPDNNGN